MNLNGTTESDQIALELTEDMMEAPMLDEDLKSRMGRDRSKSFHLPSIVAIAGAFILAILFFGVWVNSNKKSTEVELNTLMLKISMLEGRLSHLEKEVPELQNSVTKGEETQGYLTQRLNAFSQQVDQLEKQMSSAAAQEKVSVSGRQNQGTKDNGRYHEVRPGETLYRIAKRYGFSVDELCRLNGISPDDFGDIQPGQRLLISSED